MRERSTAVEQRDAYVRIMSANRKGAGKRAADDLAQQPQVELPPAQPWAAADDAELRRLVAEGGTVGWDEKARQLGGRAANDVWVRWWQVLSPGAPGPWPSGEGLAGRPSKRPALDVDAEAGAEGGTGADRLCYHSASPRAAVCGESLWSTTNDGRD